MKKIFLFLSISAVILSSQLYSMEPVFKKIGELFKPEPKKQEQPVEPQVQELPRLFIKNIREDAVVVEYTYGSGDFKNISLMRVVYPQEVIWIGSPNNITTLGLWPHGEFKQYLAMPKMLRTPVNYADEVKSNLGKGGAQMILSQAIRSKIAATVLPYSTKTEKLDIASIEPRIPLGRCDRLGNVFKHAAIINKEKGPIKPEYILGVLPKPITTNPKTIEEYDAFSNKLVVI